MFLCARLRVTVARGIRLFIIKQLLNTSSWTFCRATASRAWTTGTNKPKAVCALAGLGAAAGTASAALKSPSVSCFFDVPPGQDTTTAVRANTESSTTITTTATHRGENGMEGNGNGAQYGPSCESQVRLYHKYSRNANAASAFASKHAEETTNDRPSPCRHAAPREGPIPQNLRKSIPEDPKSRHAQPGTRTFS